MFDIQTVHQDTLSYRKSVLSIVFSCRYCLHAQTPRIPKKKHSLKFKENIILTPKYIDIYIIGAVDTFNKKYSERLLKYKILCFILEGNTIFEIQTMKTIILLIKILL